MSDEYLHSIRCIPSLCNVKQRCCYNIITTISHVISSEGLQRKKIEKVPRGIQGEKSSKDMASSRNLVSKIGAQASPKRWTEPGVRKGKRSLLASHTRCKCSMETTHNSVKVKLGIKVIHWWKVGSVGKSLLVKGQNVI